MRSRFRMDGGGGLIGEICVLLAAIAAALAAATGVFGFRSPEPTGVSTGVSGSYRARAAAARACLVFGLVAPLTYLAERFYERLRSGRVNPRAMLAEVHTSFYWRAGLAAWFGAFVALLAFRAAVREARPADRWPARMAWILLALGPFAAAWAYRFP